MISIVLLSRNTNGLTSNCLLSLRHAVGALHIEPAVEFILVDDCSDAPHGIQQLFQAFRTSTAARVKIIRFKAQQHYTRGCAYAFSAAAGSQILFVSHDMLITPAYIRTILAVASLDDSIGLVRGTSPHVDCFPQYRVRPPAGSYTLEDLNRFAESVADSQRLSYCEDSLLTGDSMLIKRAVIDKIGVMDPRYFGYFGDVDFGLRLQRAGFKMVCARGAWLSHEGAGYYKTAIKTTEQGEDAVWDARKHVVQAAYGLFREKWDRTLPEQYPGITGIDFYKLRSLPNVGFPEYQEPLQLDPNVCELV